MKKSFLFLLFSCYVFVSFTCLKAQGTHQDSLNSQIENYYALNLKVFQANSTVTDIDAIFKLFTADFEYVHPKYGGTYSRQDLYDGYVNNQENGSYDGSIIDLKIVNQLTGFNGVAVQKRFIENKEDKVTEGALELSVFEFRDGKIARIYEYW